MELKQEIKDWIELKKKKSDHGKYFER